MLFWLLVGFYGLTLLVTYNHERVHFGESLTGVRGGGAEVTPITEEALRAGLRYDHWVLEVNGFEVNPVGDPVVDDKNPTGKDPWNREDGQLNQLKVRTNLPQREEIMIDVPVVTNTVSVTWRYLGLPVIVGFLIVVVGVVSFLLRPGHRQSAALLSTSIVLGSRITIDWADRFPLEPLTHLYLCLVAGMMMALPLHLGLVFPLPYTLYLRRPSILVLVYGVGIAIGGLLYWTGPRSPFALVAAPFMCFGPAFFVGRIAAAAIRPPDRPAGQSAWVILLGTVLGFGPVLWAPSRAPLIHWVDPDGRLFLVPMLAFPLALAFAVFRLDESTPPGPPPP